MADAVLLSQETYLHLKKWLDDYGNGLKDTLQLGKGLTFEERGTDYIKIGIEASNSNIGGGSLTVSDGSTTVSSVTRMNFLGTLFAVSSGGAGVANITLKTENCA